MKITIDIIKNFTFITEKYNNFQINNFEQKIISNNLNKIYKIVINNDIYILKKAYFDKKNEFEILNKINKSKYIIQIYDYFIETPYIYYLMEYVNNNNYDITDPIIYLKNILFAINDLHKNNLIHLDIHANNFIYNYASKNFKIIDFECAEYKNNNLVLDDKFGNYYKYPSNLKLIDIYIDIWSIGILFYKYLYTNEPFNCYDNYINKIFYIDKKCKYTKLINFIFDNYEKINCEDILLYINDNYE